MLSPEKTENWSAQKSLVTTFETQKTAQDFLHSSWILYLADYNAEVEEGLVQG